MIEETGRLAEQEVHRRSGTDEPAAVDRLDSLSYKLGLNLVESSPCMQFERTSEESICKLRVGRHRGDLEALREDPVPVVLSEQLPCARAAEDRRSRRTVRLLQRVDGPAFLREVRSPLR